MINHYFCNRHGCALEFADNMLNCSIGLHSYPVENSAIPLLDEIQSSESVAFDAQNANISILSREEILVNGTIASKFLKNFNCNLNDRLNILDVACGKGEFSIYMASEVLTNSNFYCFDHSYSSLQILSNTSSSKGLKNIHVSLQDINQLNFRPQFFDYIYGNAVLHHFLNWRECLSSLLTFLKPGGQMIFSEPFAPGYLMLVNILTMALKRLNLASSELNNPEFGLLSFIMNDIYSRCNLREDANYLNTLIDKHLFTEEDFYSFSVDNNVSPTFSSYENDIFYENFMSLFLSSYNIKQQDLCDIAQELYASIYQSLRASYPSFYPHFQIISLRKVV